VSDPTVVRQAKANRALADLDGFTAMLDAALNDPSIQRKIIDVIGRHNARRSPAAPRPTSAREIRQGKGSRRG
jgi:hypothetical protein